MNEFTKVSSSSSSSYAFHPVVVVTRFGDIIPDPASEAECALSSGIKPVNFVGLGKPAFFEATLVLSGDGNCGV